MWRISQWRSTHDTTDTLIVRPRYRAVPRNPRVATHWCHDPLQPRPQKMEEKNPSQLLHSPAHWSIVDFVKRGVVFLTAKIRGKRRLEPLLSHLKVHRVHMSSDTQWWPQKHALIHQKQRSCTPRLRLQVPQVCPFRRPSIPVTTINLRVRVLKVRFGFWKFVVPLPCRTIPWKCQQLHHHRTLALRARAKY